MISGVWELECLWLADTLEFGSGELSKGIDGWLFAATWVHVFEEDTEKGAVYRSERDVIPLSRRPRERLTLHADGSAQVYVAGPDDRFVELECRWKKETGGAIVVTRARRVELRIVERSPARLVVQRERGR